MDNTVLPYKDQIDSSDESDSSDSSEEGNMLTNNIGVLYNGSDIKDERFMNREKVEDYQIQRNKLFTPKLSKLRLLIDSKNIDHSSDHNTSNYTIKFKGQDHLNKTSGFSTYNNVIGFKFIQSIIPNSVYQVTPNNNTINLIISSNVYPIQLDEGKYTFEEIGDHLQNKLNTNPHGANFTVVSNPVTMKYTIESNNQFSIDWEQSFGYAYNLFGFTNSVYDSSQLVPPLNIHTIISDNIPQQSIHFVDLVIPEIPHIACKKNSYGKNVIERIPLGEGGSLREYTNDCNLNNYFYPINLSQLTIQLYEDKSDLFYECQNANNSFEFEITILNY